MAPGIVVRSGRKDPLLVICSITGCRLLRCAGSAFVALALLAPREWCGRVGALLPLPFASRSKPQASAEAPGGGKGVGGVVRAWVLRGAVSVRRVEWIHCGLSLAVVDVHLWVPRVRLALRAGLWVLFC